MRPATSFVAVLSLCAFALPAAAQAEPGKKGKVEEEFPKWTVQGTLFTDISAVEADKGRRSPIPEEGFIGEYSLGGTYHIDKKMTVVVRACLGCHDFQVQNAYVDWEINDNWTFRAGRIPVPFGGFSRRTSPAHVESSTKPLPYIMGGMVQEKAFNMGIVPAPFIDNGAAMNGKFWITKTTELSVEVGVVRGLKGFTTDVDYVVTREPKDSNGEPAVAGRVLVTADPITAGASATWGRYDPDAELDYVMASVELQVRLGAFNLRLEGVLRDTDYFTPTQSIETSRRTAYVIQVDGPIADGLRGFVLHDAMKVDNIFLGPAGPANAASPLTTDDSNTITRFAGGVVYSLRPGLTIKGSVEYWDPSDFEKAIVLHVGVVVEY